MPRGNQGLNQKTSTASAKPRRNQYGQAMGAKGQQTRQRLLEATQELIRTKPLRELTISDITRLAKTSTSTFYLYFQDVSEAVLALAGAVSQSTPELLGLLLTPWGARTAHQQAQAFADSYIETWIRNRDLFRVRNLAADEGDMRFADARRLATLPLVEALAVRIAENQRAGIVPADLHPYSTAGALLAMLERIAAIPIDTLARSTHEVSHEKVVHAAAFFAACVISNEPGILAPIRSGAEPKN